MNTSSQKWSSVDDYIVAQDPSVQDILREFRERIRRLSPDAVESISYGMPAYKLHGKPLVYFAAFQHHIGFYATPTGHEAFAQELSAYKQGKGSVQFPLDRAMPFDLIERIVLFRIQENTAHYANKKKK
jgi:uncharacterized protein YdhG (YjbR/CyaY superfamily)